MKLTMTSVAIAAVCASLTGIATPQDASSKPPSALRATVDVRESAPPISPYLYGGFIEHAGTLIYRSLWSELIDDRKFYFPIVSSDPVAQTGAGTRAFRAPLRKWRPVGPDQVVTMDKDQPFVGDQSPRIELEPGAPHGIRQTGFTVVNGKGYVGRIYLRGTPGAKVTVSLVWGEGPESRQTLSFGKVSPQYKRYPLRFTSKADSAAASLEITGSGTGSFHVGTVSLMPADNVQGFRPDTIAMLRELHAGMWRLPGGNFLSDWSWYGSVGDPDKRPPMFDHAWDAMQTNDVGMDEFMTLCKLIGVEPYVSVNAGFGDSHSAAEEVEYLNGPASTYMGAQRARNGHPEPYRVKFWNIGNEPYGSWQLGHTDLKYYVLKHNEFAKAMREVDPSITLLASGAMPDEMTVEGQPRVMHMADPQARFGTDGDWTGGLLAHCWGNFDGITEHWYSRAGKRFDYEHAKTLPADAPIEGGYVNVDETELQWVRHPSDRVRKKAEEWAEYEKRFPAMRDKNIFLSIDEYAYGGGGGANLKTALAYSMILNEMFRHTEFMKMAAYTMAISTLDYNTTGAVYNSRGVLYKLYRDQFGTIPVSVTGNSPQPAPRYPPYGDQPETSAGSPTYPLDMSAALTEDRKTLTVAVVNATDRAQPFSLDLNGARLSGPGTQFQMSGTSLEAENHVGQPAQVQVKQTPLQGDAKSLSVAPGTVTIFRFPIS